MEQEMRYIWEIWREGSFSKAAEKLYLSQPALSMAVSKAERALGAPLFDRSRRPPTLTQSHRATPAVARSSASVSGRVSRPGLRKLRRTRRSNRGGGASSRKISAAAKAAVRSASRTV